MQNFQEQRLVARVSEYQDQDAFVALHGQYFGKIREFIMFRIGRKEDVEDLANQVFLKAWEYLTSASTKKMQNFRAFLYKVTRNEVANFYRRQGRTPTLVEIDKPDEYGEYPDIPDERENPFWQMARTQDADSLIECVQKLPEPYREIIALRFFEELEIQEVADIIGKTLGNTRVLIHRGVKKMQGMMTV